MNFPVWELHWAGGGLLIAAMAVFHVYIAHFAVGGGLFLVLTERMGYRRNSPGILEYTRRHTKFFLLVTMVLGGITGVGIWFTISLLSPAATAQLIHTFVFAWAIEWVFFLGEIVALFVYFYTFGKIRPRTHMTAGWLYFFFGWMSLFMINGIIGFMLTPGDWLSTRDFWDGFFNPSFWPALAFRTCLAFMLAGLYGFVTAAWEKETALREAMVRHCALWLLAPFAILLLSGWWYVNALPEAQEAMVLGANPEIAPFLQGFVLISAALFAGGLIMAARMPALAKRSVAVTLLVIGLMYMGCFEWTREAGRRPYLIHSYMYSNGVLAGSEKAVSATGYLKTSGWNRHQTVTAENMVDAGREIFRGQCSSCHSIGGPMKDIRKYTAGIGVMGLEALISGMGKVYEYMPVFVGTRQERTALATYLAREINGQTETSGGKRPARPEIRPAVLAFDPEEDDYVLLAWSVPGQKTISDCDAQFSLLPPGSTLRAQLIRRDAQPVIVTEDVVLTFSAPAGFEHPSRQVEFWKHARSLTGKDLPPDTGLTGRGMSGTMTLDEEHRAFTAENIPVLPYGEGLPNPYPVFTIEARSQDGELLAVTQVAVPVSTELGCKNCHGGSWSRDGVMGVSARTASDVLRKHDRRHKTTLMAQAESGAPVSCQSCHADPLTDAPGKPELLSLSAAMHGFHANYLSGLSGAEACNACHATGPDSYTASFRGVHSRQSGESCARCHGTMEDHALSLLQAEKDKPKAGKLMRHLRPRLVSAVEDVNPRTPWNSLPDCLACHVEFERPESVKVTAFNQWAENDDLYQNRVDEAGLMCQACHGSAHAEHPAINPFNSGLDSLQPMRYQGNRRPIGAGGNCAVCHREEMDAELHHPNMLKN